MLRMIPHPRFTEEDKRVEWFGGNFTDYEEDKKRRLGAEEPIPHRMKHKEFAR